MRDKQLGKEREWGFESVERAVAIVKDISPL